MSGLHGTYSTALTDTSATRKETLGALRLEYTSNGPKWYKYVKFDNGAGGVDAEVNHFCGYFGLDGYKNNTVTSDTSVAANRTTPAGMFISVPSDNDYCWIQIKGHFDGAAEDIVGGADGNLLRLDGTTDMRLEPVDGHADCPIAMATDDSDGEGVLIAPF